MISINWLAGKRITAGMFALAGLIAGAWYVGQGILGLGLGCFGVAVAAVALGWAGSQNASEAATNKARVDN